MQKLPTEILPIHKYSVEDKAEVKIAIVHLNNLRERIETDVKAKEKVEHLIYTLEDFLEEIEHR